MRVSIKIDLHESGGSVDETINNLYTLLDEHGKDYGISFPESMISSIYIDPLEMTDRFFQNQSQFEDETK